MRNEEFFNGLIGKNITFNNGVLKTELMFDPNQKAKVTRIEPIRYEDGDVVVKIWCDFSEFEEENKNHAKANFWDENGQPTLKWHETELYPSIPIETIFVCDDISDLPFEVL